MTDYTKKSLDLLSGLATITVITAVGDFKYAMPSDGTKNGVVSSGDNKAVQSQFNLITGDVTTLMDYSFTNDGDNAGLLSFHHDHIALANGMAERIISAGATIAGYDKA